MPPIKTCFGRLRKLIQLFNGQPAVLLRKLQSLRLRGRNCLFRPVAFARNLVRGQKEKSQIRSASLALPLVVVIMMSEVNAYIEVVVVPIRFMIPAPLPSRIHSGYIVIDLAAVFAVAANIVIDSCAIRFQTTMAICLPIFVCASCTSKSEYEPASQRTCKNHPTPKFIARHDCLRGASFGARAVPLFGACH
jgi:hypothetical protein